MITLKIDIPQNARLILSTLTENGYEAFIVGGCVRDSLLNKIPSDWDITTNAKPEAVIKLFSNTVPTGLKHGTVTVVIDKTPYEVTTYRIEGDYSDSRHPDNVRFTDNIIKDLERRDFTINAMAYNDIKGLTDPFNGMHDLESHCVKCVGNADERFKEDALRMLRAIRFSCQLDFTIEEGTYAAIVSNSCLIQKISIERINTELYKILMSNFPSEGIYNLNKTGLLHYILPELEADAQLEHIMACLSLTGKEFCLRLSTLLHHIDDKNLTVILKRLKFDNLTFKNVVQIVAEYNKLNLAINCIEIKKLIARIGKENINMVIQLAYADINSRPDISCFENSVKIEQLKKFKFSVEKIIASKEPVKISDLKITGNDLKSLGYLEGEEIGIVLSRLLNMVLENPDLNTKEKLIGIVTKKIRMLF